jgi:hypothetical protein
MVMLGRPHLIIIVWRPERVVELLVGDMAAKAATVIEAPRTLKPENILFDSRGLVVTHCHAGA